MDLMKKFIIDTNILVGAMGNYYKEPGKPPGINAKIVLGALLEYFQPAFTHSLVKEYLYQLKDKHLPGMKYLDGKPRPPQWLGDFLNKGALYKDMPFARIPGVFYTADDDDFPILCLSIDQDFPIVTKNLKDFPEEGRYGASVLNPRDFLEREPSLKTINSWDSWAM